MKRVIVTTVFVLGLVAVCADQMQAAENQSQVKRGEYIVHHVAMCVQCHSPRNDRGELIMARSFRGAPIPLESPFSNQQWARRAPSIAGFMGYTQEEAVRFLMTGNTRRGGKPMPPMPPFRMNLEDAEAVYAYLSSIR